MNGFMGGKDMAAAVQKRGLWRFGQAGRHRAQSNHGHTVLWRKSAKYLRSKSSNNECCVC